MSHIKAPPWTLEADGVRLTVRLTPKSSRDEIAGIETLADGTSVLKARVRAVPADGKANAALISLLSASLKLPRRDITLKAGHTARVKTLTLSGDPAGLEAKLRRLLE